MRSSPNRISTNIDQYLIRLNVSLHFLLSWYLHATHGMEVRSIYFWEMIRSYCNLASTSCGSGKCELLAEVMKSEIVFLFVSVAWRKLRYWWRAECPTVDRRCDRNINGWSSAWSGISGTTEWMENKQQATRTQAICSRAQRWDIFMQVCVGSQVIDNTFIYRTVKLIIHLT